jgi:hypothetical protein
MPPLLYTAVSLNSAYIDTSSPNQPWLWHLQALCPFVEPEPPEFLRVLPPPAAGPFRRPIVLIQGTDLALWT